MVILTGSGNAKSGTHLRLVPQDNDTTTPDDIDFENLDDLRLLKNISASKVLKLDQELSDQIWRIVDRIQLRIDPVDEEVLAA